MEALQSRKRRVTFKQNLVEVKIIESLATTRPAEQAKDVGLPRSVARVPGRPDLTIDNFLKDIFQWKVKWLDVSIELGQSNANANKETVLGRHVESRRNFRTHVSHTNGAVVHSSSAQSWGKWVKIALSHTNGAMLHPSSAQSWAKWVKIALKVADFGRLSRLASFLKLRLQANTLPRYLEACF